MKLDYILCRKYLLGKFCMLGHTWRYMVIPAIAMLVTLFIFTKFNLLDKSQKAGEEIKPSEVVEEIPEIKIGGDFTLINQNGNRVSSTVYKDKIKLVYFGFTSCPDICPTDLANITAALNLLDENQLDKIQPIFITIDPERDTVKVIKTYLSSFHPKIEGFTGTNDEIVKVIKDFRVFSEKVNDENLGDYLMNHSAYTYIVGKNGYYLSHFNHNEDPKKIAEGIIKKL